MDSCPVSWKLANLTYLANDMANDLALAKYMRRRPPRPGTYGWGGRENEAVSGASAPVAGRRPHRGTIGPLKAVAPT